MKAIRKRKQKIAEVVSRKEKSEKKSAKKLNCKNLLQHLQETESWLPPKEDAHFGHPATPKVSLVEVSPGKTLMVAWSERCVSAQLSGGKSSSDDGPIDVLVVADEEIITCCTLLRRSNESAAVVVGTDSSKVLSVELQCSRSLTRASDGAPLEPLPLDDPSKKDPMPPKPREDSDSLQTGSLHSVRRQREFRPQGGVSSLSSYNIDSKSFVWVSYGDGTIIRLSPLCFFTQDDMVEIGHDSVRAQVMIDPASDAEVVACPKYHPSPLAPLAPWNKPDEGTSATSSVSYEDESRIPEFFEALVFDTGGTTLVFYTSENQSFGRANGENDPSRSGEDHVLFGHAVGATTAIVKGVVGAIKWGMGSNKDQPPGQINVDGPVDMDDDRPFIEPLYIALHEEPAKLYAGSVLHDTPRQITSIAIDPTGDLAAAADTLGRVLLFDLRLKQVLRLWKGVRDATCCWTRTADALHLCIHSRQRRTVEMWKIRRGSKVNAVQVQRDSQMIECLRVNGDTSCYLLTTSKGGSGSHVLKEFLPSDDYVKSRSVATGGSSSSSSRPSESLQKAAFRLRTLQQMLAETNVPCKKQDVFGALVQITSLSDLATALDFLAVSTTLEDRMGVTGSDFHTVALTHCRKVLERATSKKGSAKKESAQVKHLTARIQYHTQLVEAYEVLQEFEAVGGRGDADQEKVAPRSTWAVEAFSWMATHEAVTGESFEGKTDIKSVRFATFAKSCTGADQVELEKQGSQTFAIYLSDSTKTRKDILKHIFKPLLKDIFSFGVSNTIFQFLGVRDDLGYMQQCFGEWFMSIPAKNAAERAFCSLYSPMVRWLHLLIGRQIETDMESQGKSFPTPAYIVLSSLFDFCMVEEDLIRAFSLAALCREAVSVVSKKMEAKTYGKVSHTDAITPWDELMRKIRVCLFVSLRLNGERLGTFPITVKNVESDDIFSVFEWVARDELHTTNEHHELVAFEAACAQSGMVFDPSTPMGDNIARRKKLQQACRGNFGDGAGADRMEVDEVVHGALLLYISSHNIPEVLVAHRALLLADQWGRDPADTNLLVACVTALANMSEEGSSLKTLATAIRMEVWQTRIRPVYRAFFFGFDDVHELTEEVVGPLLQGSNWMKAVGLSANTILNLLLNGLGEMDKENFQVPWTAPEGCWPPVRPDSVLNRMVDRARPADANSLAVHRAILCGSMLSDDFATLSECVPGFYESFEAGALFHSLGPLQVDDATKQIKFLERGAIDKARKHANVVLDTLELGEAESLAMLWGIEVRDVATIFMLAMYELGKDVLVDDMLVKSTNRLDMHRFVEDGLGIACRRLHYLMTAKRSRTPALRGVMGALDADTCEWVRDQAGLSDPLVGGDDENLSVAVSLTHLFVLRLLSFASAMGLKDFRIKIHALSVLSGTVSRALENTDI